MRTGSVKGDSIETESASNPLKTTRWGMVKRLGKQPARSSHLSEPWKREQLLKGTQISSNGWETKVGVPDREPGNAGCYRKTPKAKRINSSSKKATYIKGQRKITELLPIATIPSSTSPTSLEETLRSNTYLSYRRKEKPISTDFTDSDSSLSNARKTSIDNHAKQWKERPEDDSDDDAMSTTSKMFLLSFLLPSLFRQRIR